MEEYQRVAVALGGRPITYGDHPELFNAVMRQAANARLPRLPTVYLLPDEMPNAFTTGKDESECLIAVTRGLVRDLSLEQTEAVIAHEMGHIIHHDVERKTAVALKAVAVSTVGEVVAYEIATSGVDFTPWDDDSDDALSGAITVGLAVATTVAANGISRRWMEEESYQEEYGADAYSAQQVDSLSLMSALRAIENYIHSPKKAPTRKPAEICQLFIVSPFQYKTHPPTDARIQRLAEVGGHSVAELESSGVVTGMYCPYCGSHNGKDALYCCECGKYVEGM